MPKDVVERVRALYADGGEDGREDHGLRLTLLMSRCR